MSVGDWYRWMLFEWEIWWGLDDGSQGRSKQHLVSDNNCICATIELRELGVVSWFIAKEFVHNVRLGVHHNVWYVERPNPSVPIRKTYICVCHLHSNMKYACFRVEIMEIALWRTARVSTVNEREYRIKELTDTDEHDFQWIQDKPPHQWSRSHFSTEPKYNIFLNNGCESFNVYILETRQMLVWDEFQWIIEYLITWLQENRDRTTRRWAKGVICLKIRKLVNQIIDKVGNCVPIKTDDGHCKVACYDDIQFFVDLVQHICECQI